MMWSFVILPCSVDVECSQVILSLLSERPHGLISFVEGSPNADLSQVLRDDSPWGIPIWPPCSRGEKLMASWLTEPCATSFLFSFVASFVIFDALEFSLNWFFTLNTYDKKIGSR